MCSQSKGRRLENLQLNPEVKTREDHYLTCIKIRVVLVRLALISHDLISRTSG